MAEASPPPATLFTAPSAGPISVPLRLAVGLTGTTVTTGRRTIELRYDLLQITRRVTWLTLTAIASRGKREAMNVRGAERKSLRTVTEVMTQVEEGLVICELLLGRVFKGKEEEKTGESKRKTLLL